MSQSWRSVAAIVLALFVVINVVSFVWFPFLPWFEQRQAGEEIVREEMDAQQALDDYRWFRQQYQDIQAQREIIANSYDERERFYEIHGKDPSQWSRTAETRHGRIEQRITGNQNQLETMVADYNARSQDATSSVFKCSLPYQVDERFAVTGPPGSGPAEQPVDKTIDGEPVEGEPPSAEQCDGLPEEVQREAQ